SQRAQMLKKKFNEQFWDPSRQYFNLGLDGNKQAISTLTSNPGHGLAAEIVDQDKYKHVVKTLLSDELFSGWGIRTLSREEKRYNPMSYHNGSVWPHDNSMIAYGMF